MKTKRLVGLLSLAVVASAAWLGGAGQGSKVAVAAWVEVRPGVLRTSTLPAGYALVEGDAALLIGAPQEAGGLKAHGVKHVEGVLLTHHHRATCAAAGRFLADKVPVRAPKASAEWLLPENVRNYWQTSLPLRTSRAPYLVVPAGFAGLDCTLENNQTIAWRGWTIRVVETPGPARDHVALLAQKGKNGPLLAFCGDALAAPGKLWAPYTTDWDHWTDAG